MFAGSATRLLGYEARSLLERLNEIRPFALTLPMVAAAAPSVAAQAAIDGFLAEGRRELRTLVARFLAWLDSPAGVAASAATAQRHFTVVRLRFLAVLTQFDVFADALTERSQHGYGEWLGGLDVAATDALTLPGRPFEPPPVICHLDRGPGAAIRRVRTRLPGGGVNPVALIRVPRERMVGSAIASSLVHEVGHQGAEQLGLVAALHAHLGAMAAARPAQRAEWSCLQQWISEIVADWWSVAHVGIGSTLGLISVVGLPRPFVVRLGLDDPHPPPWIRVKISAAIGARLYPDAQWGQLAALWESLYPLHGAATPEARLFGRLEEVLPEFAALLADFRPPSLQGRTLAQTFPVHDRQPARLRALWQTQQAHPETLAALPATLAFAVVGQAKYDGRIGAAAEVALLRRLLRFWALHSTVDSREVCAQAQARGMARAV